MAAPRIHRILVVDDDAAVRALLTRYLELEGYEVDQAADGASAMAALKAHPPDLLLLDVMLPMEDGLHVLTRLRKDSDVAVILLTGRDAEADRVLGLKLGADDYVVKPFSTAEIAARIATVLRRVRNTGLGFRPGTEGSGSRFLRCSGRPAEPDALRRLLLGRRPRGRLRRMGRPANSCAAPARAQLRGCVGWR